MKLIIIILAALFSSSMKTSDPSPVSVYGTWKGYYGTEKEIHSIIIRIDPQNKAEIVFNQNNDVLRSKASYRLTTDSKIVISSLFPDQTSFEMVLTGNLNRTSSFIDGKWDGKGKEGGCFYLQKQFDPVMMNL